MDGGLFCSYFQSGSGLSVSLFHRCATAELDAATVIDSKALDLHLVADLADILDCANALVGEFRDMAETILAGKDLDERAEFLDTGDGALVYLARLGFRRDGVHLGLGHCHHVAGGGEDGHDAKVALFLDVDLGARLLADAANRLAALTDERQRMRF